jgi:hypothetical protein
MFQSSVPMMRWGSNAGRRLTLDGIEVRAGVTREVSTDRNYKHKQCSTVSTVIFPGRC